MPAALRPSTSRVAASIAAGRPMWVSTATRRPSHLRQHIQPGRRPELADWRRRSSAKNSWLPAGPEQPARHRRQQVPAASARLGHDLVDRLAVQRRLADHAALAELLAAHLELRLDHQQHPPRRR